MEMRNTCQVKLSAGSADCQWLSEVKLKFTHFFFVVVVQKLTG